MHREPEVLEAEAQVGKWLGCRARITSEELALLHSVKNGILQNACSTSLRMDADLGKSPLMRIASLMNSLAKGLKRMGQKCSGYVEITCRLGCVFQDMEPPKASSILQKSSNTRKPIRFIKNHRIQCNTVNFVPIVVPGLSKSSSSSFHSSTSMKPSRQGSNHPTSSSSSSTSTPTTSSTEIGHSDHPPTIMSSESVDRQVRGDPNGTDHHPQSCQVKVWKGKYGETRIFLKHQKSC